jgi:hypothetical protein
MVSLEIIRQLIREALEVYPDGLNIIGIECKIKLVTSAINWLDIQNALRALVREKQIKKKLLKDGTFVYILKK